MSEIRYIMPIQWHAVIAPKIVINLNDSIFDLKICDAVQLHDGQMGFIISIDCQDPENPMLHTVALLPALVAFDLTRSDQRCALRLIKQSSLSSLSLNRILIALPKDS